MFSLRDSFWVLFTIFVISPVICLNSSPPSTWWSGKLWGWKVPKHKWLLCIHRVCSLLVMAQLKVTAILTKATLLNKSPEHVSLPGAALFLWLHPPKWFWKLKLKLTFRSKGWSAFILVSISCHQEDTHITGWDSGAESRVTDGKLGKESPGFIKGPCFHPGGNGCRESCDMSC